MDKIPWLVFHTLLFFPLCALCMTTEMVKEGKEIHKEIKHPKRKIDRSIGEDIIVFVLALVAIGIVLTGVFVLFVRNRESLIWFICVFGSVYLYLAIKQIVKMIIIPGKGSFSAADIKDFIYTYIFWWMFVLGITTIESVDSLIEQMPLAYKSSTKIMALFVWYYFNILFVLGGAYILLYYLRIFGKKLSVKAGNIYNMIENIMQSLLCWWSKGYKHKRLLCFTIWEKESRMFYKISMVIPAFVLDFLHTLLMFIQVFIEVSIKFMLVLILDPIRLVHKYAKLLWHRYENNEWMYMFAQVAGLCSYGIVFVAIQLGNNSETEKTIYEFVGTIVLIPYLISKLVYVSKRVKKEKKGN